MSVWLSMDDNVSRICWRFDICVERYIAVPAWATAKHPPAQAFPLEFAGNSAGNFILSDIATTEMMKRLEAVGRGSRLCLCLVALFLTYCIGCNALGGQEETPDENGNCCAGQHKLENRKASLRLSADGLVMAEAALPHEVCPGPRDQQPAGLDRQRLHKVRPL
jgi:hypothetical protein